MPPLIPPPPVKAPFLPVNAVLDLVRVRMNDAIGSLAGDILQNAQPFMQEYTNGGWIELQNYLAVMGYSALKGPFFGKAYPVVDNYDPATWTSLSWTQFVNASGGIIAPPLVDVLPQNMILPLRVSERITGTLTRWASMDMAKDQLPATNKTAYNGWWLWESNTLYMPGSVYSMDLRMELALYFPDFQTDGIGNWYDKPVPIMRSKSALAWFICAEVAGAREDIDADPFIAKAQAAARQIFNIEVSQKQRVPTQRRAFGGHRTGQYNGGYDFGYF